MDHVIRNSMIGLWRIAFKNLFVLNVVENRLFMKIARQLSNQCQQIHRIGTCMGLILLLKTSHEEAAKFPRFPNFSTSKKPSMLLHQAGSSLLPPINVQSCVPKELRRGTYHVSKIRSLLLPTQLNSTSNNDFNQRSKRNSITKTSCILHKIAQVLST